MSSYLVAFVVSNFKVINMNSSKYNTLIEISAKPESIERGDGDFALKEAGLILDYFGDIFDMVYPLKKLTNIAIPDFNAGAMENFGLITYREKYLLYNPANDTLRSKYLVSLVVAHEIAHQWVKEK